MPIGPTIRAALGPLEPLACTLYRRIFVNVEAVGERIADTLPPNAQVVDVGGGDGVILDAVLRRRPDVKAAMLDLKADIGRLLSPGVRDRVVMHPATDMASFGPTEADAVLVCDVLHHVPPPLRPGFMADARALLRPGGMLVVKDIAPHHPRSWLGWLADRFISGDANVSLVPADSLPGLAGMPMQPIATGLFCCNYIVRLDRVAEAG